MPSFDPNDPISSAMEPNAPTRRKMLGTLAAAGALLGLDPTASAQSKKKPAEPLATATPPPAPEALFAMAHLRDYKCHRSSSWDTTGGNADFRPVDPGASLTLLDVNGPGVITHIWFTINSDDHMHLKNLVLRAWWDGESSPSIEAPIGDFYGLMLGEYFNYQSALLAVAPQKALNCYFQMPFGSAARITLTNEGKVRTNSLYFAVDYTTVAALPPNLGRFHAQYRQAAPCKKSGDTSGKNLSGVDNYVFFEATGRGHFVGVTQGVLQNSDGWFGEGDDMIFIDGEPQPVINGTGTEDYYNGAWDFYGNAFANQRQGAPFIIDPERTGGRYCLYRWHTESFITFEKSIKVTIEHGHANDRADNFYSVGYWYQTEPHAEFPQLPPPEARAPKVIMS
ncbi:MAG TPA: glycoside hydrolase family 172 protein [Terracidiphilus sp.]|nr:glycoside hydrolase family 172 protein [Terracidiphilus sp.]